MNEYIPNNFKFYHMLCLFESLVKSFTSALDDPCLDVAAVIFRAASNDTLIGSRSYHMGVVNIE